MAPPSLAVSLAFTQGGQIRLVDTSGTGGIKGKRPSKKDKLRAAAAAAQAATGPDGV